MPGNRAHSLSRQGPREASLVVCDEHLFSKVRLTAKVTSMLRCARLLPTRVPLAMQPTETARLDSLVGWAARRIGEPCDAAWNEKPDRGSGVYMPVRRFCRHQA